MDIEINFCGRYGEHFVYLHSDNDEYVVSCEEIDMKDVSMQKQEFDELFDKYYRKGIPEFDKNNKEKMYLRASNLGRELSSNFWFFKRNNGTYEKLVSAIKVYEILNDIKVLELTEEEYMNHFLKYNDKVTDEYVQLMIELKERIIDGRRR